MEWRKYGTQTKVYFPLITAGSANFAASTAYTFAAGDVTLVRDGVAWGNATCALSPIGSGSGTVWALNLTASEMSASVIAATVADAATKAVEDQMVIVSTYGAGSGLIDLFDFADALLARDMALVSNSASRSPQNALRFLRNKWSVSGSTLTVTAEDDSTTAWTSTISSDGSAAPIVSNDPA